MLLIMMILYLVVAAAMIPVVAVESGRSYERGQRSIRDLLALSIAGSIFWPIFLGGAIMSHLWRSR